MNLNRKLKLIGGYSFLVCLPKDWIRRNGLKQKDVVQLIPQENGDLLVKAGGFDVPN